MVDIAVLIGLGAIALRSDRFWPLWATAFQLNSVASHILMYLEPENLLQGYALAQGFWAYPIMISLVLAAHRHATIMRKSRSHDIE